MDVVVSRFVTCDSISRTVPFTLRRVRRHWRWPPHRLGIYIEFQRHDEGAEFSWCLRIWRGTVLIDSTVSELELPGTRFIEYTQETRLQDASPKTYRLEVVIDGVSAASTVIDFGAQEAAP